MTMILIIRLVLFALALLIAGGIGWYLIERSAQVFRGRHF
jgi:hypothetical protein